MQLIECFSFIFKPWGRCPTQQASFWQQLHSWSFISTLKSPSYPFLWGLWCYQKQFCILPCLIWMISLIIAWHAKNSSCAGAIVLHIWKKSIQFQVVSHPFTITMYFCHKSPFLKTNGHNEKKFFSTTVWIHLIFPDHQRIYPETAWHGVKNLLPFSSKILKLANHHSISWYLPLTNIDGIVIILSPDLGCSHLGRC